MKKIKLGIIRVLTIDNKEMLRTHERILKEKFPCFEIETKCISNQPEGIYNYDTEMTAIPKIIDVAQVFEEEGFDAIFLSCAADPGIDLCRKKVKIPVLGAGSSAASLALSFSNKIGVIGITDKTPNPIVEILKDNLMYETKPDGVTTVLDLYSEAGTHKVMESASILKDKGCDTILLACTGLTTLKIYKKIMEELNIIAIDPVLAAGTMISYFLDR